MILKLVHFGKYYLPETGGIESVTASLARGASDAGHHVVVVCFKKSIAAGDEVVDGVTVRRAPVVRLIASQPLGFRYVWLCLKEARSADLVHLHAPNMLGALCCLLVGKRPKVLVHWHSDVVGKGWLGKVLGPLESALLRRADCIVATSQAYAEASQPLRRFRHKVSVVPIGVPDSRASGLPDLTDEALPSAVRDVLRGKQLVLAVGRLVPYKGFDTLIRAAKQLREDAVVVIVGDGPLRKTLEGEIERARLALRVVLAGRLNSAALHALFAQASLYCLPSVSRAEAFGVVLLEAMSYGLPVVASDIPGSGVPWVNQHGLTGFNVPLGDATALAQACNRILDCTQERAHLSHSARRRFLGEFTEERFVKRMLEVYRRLVTV